MYAGWGKLHACKTICRAMKKSGKNLDQDATDQPTGGE